MRVPACPTGRLLLALSGPRATYSSWSAIGARADALINHVQSPLVSRQRPYGEHARRLHAGCTAMTSNPLPCLGCSARADEAQKAQKEPRGRAAALSLRTKRSGGA
jgi:hypothetical protein